MTDTYSGPPNGDGGTAQQAQEKAQEVAGQAQEKAQQAMGQARGRARDAIDQRSTQAGEQVAQQAGDLRSVGEQLRGQGKEGPAKIADQAAERAERVGSYLKDSDADRILHDVEDYARQNPWTVALGGLALGFAASRFLKASSSERYQQRASAGTTRPGLPQHAQSFGAPEPARGGTPDGALGTQPVAPAYTASPVGSL